jgi:hypothetical protein
MPKTWYLAAGQEVVAGRLTSAEAGATLRESVLRLCRAPL